MTLSESDGFSEPPRSSTDESTRELENQLSLLFDLMEGNSSPQSSTQPKTAARSPAFDSTSGAPAEDAEALVVNWVEVEPAIAPESEPLPSLSVEPAIASENTFAPASREAGREPASPERPSPNTEAGSDPEAAVFAQLRNLLVGSDNEAEAQVQHLSQQVRQLQHQISDSNALIELLLPVVAELLDRKVQQSREDVCHALYPIADGIIDQRARQDRDAMSGVLAKIIPAAISQEIKDAPHEIVKAIAPAMGAAIREQVRLDRNSIAQVLAPEMGRAIKQQVDLERDTMVDALYPVIGGIIKRYLAEAIQEINEKLSNTLSTESIKRKIRAKLKGVSEAELILTESMPLRVKAVFLIHKASGLVICQSHHSDALTLDAEMIGGMLTAIRSFVRDCIAPSGGESELNQIEYGDSKILLEVAGYCYLAIVVQGTPPAAFIDKIRNTLGYIIQRYSESIERFDGDPLILPEALPSSVASLMEIEDKSVKPREVPWTLIGAIGALSLAIGIPWHLHQRQQALNRQLERAALSALYDNPELSVYRFNATANRQQLILQGRVPSPSLRDKAATLVAPLLGKQQLDNRILAVEIPPDPDRVRAEVQRVEALLNQESGLAITARYETLPDTGELPTRGKVTLSGLVKSAAAVEKATRAFEQIPGISNVSTAFGLPSVNIPTRIYFNQGSSQIESIDLKVKIESVVRTLNQYPDLQLEIIGYSPTSEGENSSQLAFGRATAVRTALLERGIASDRLQVRGLTGVPSDVGGNSPDWLAQCVRFEAIAPTLAPNAAN